MIKRYAQPPGLRWFSRHTSTPSRLISCLIKAVKSSSDDSVNKKISGCILLKKFFRQEKVGGKLPDRSGSDKNPLE
jgi:hypothetical protein